MKSFLINAFAAWDTFITTFQDGNVFRESNIDQLIGSIGNRLGYLKTQVDNRALLTGDNNFQGAQVFETGTVQFGTTLSGSVEFARPIDATDMPATFGHVTATGFEMPTSHDGIRTRRFILPDATLVLTDANYDHYRVPTLSASVVYTFPDHADYAGRRIRISRVTTEAFTVRIRRSGSAPTNLLTFGSGDKGWCDLEADASGVWRVAGWYGAATVDSSEV